MPSKPNTPSSPTSINSSSSSTNRHSALNARPLPVYGLSANNYAVQMISTGSMKICGNCYGSGESTSVPNQICYYCKGVGALQQQPKK